MRRSGTGALERGGALKGLVFSGEWHAWMRRRVKGKGGAQYGR